MQAKATQMWRWTLSIAIVSALTMIVSLAVSLGGQRVPLPFFVAVASTSAAASVGWVVVTCARWLMTYFDDHMAQCEELRRAIADFTTSVEEYGDQRATNARIDVLRLLGGQHDTGPADAIRAVTQIRPQSRRHTSA